MRIPKTQVVFVCGSAAKSKNLKDQPESYFKVYSIGWKNVYFGLGF